MISTTQFLKLSETAQAAQIVELKQLRNVIQDRVVSLNSFIASNTSEFSDEEYNLFQLEAFSLRQLNFILSARIVALIKITK